MFKQKIETIKKFIASDSGATAIEYGLIAAGIAIVIIAALGLVGDELTTLFGKVKTALAGG